MSAPTRSYYVLRAGQPEALEREHSGGKGAALAAMVQAGLPVPPFFVVAVEAHSRFADVEPDSAFLADLRLAYDELGGDEVALAARSSAVSEDAAGGSSAGLYESRLGVRGFDDLLTAMRECWASLSNAAAVQYRTDRQTDGGGMAVVVQRLVEGTWSGATFTANPVNYALGQMVINAVPGLGEDLMAGSVNPEEITVDAAEGRILDRRGAGESMPDALVHDVWDLSRRVAEHFTFPQDIEWTVLDGRVWLLQARPVTTLGGVFYNRYIEPWRDDPKTAEEPDTLWTRAYGDEVWTSPESPLNYSVRNPPGASAGWFGAYLPAHGDSRPLPAACAKYVGAAAYANIDVLRRIYEYHPKIARIAGVLNFFPESMQADVKDAPWRWRGRLKRHWQLEVKDRKRTSLAHNHRYIETLAPPLIEQSDRWFDMDLDSLSGEELRDHLAKDVMAQVGVTGLYYAIAVMYHSFDLTFLLTGLLERWFHDGDVLYARVSSGLEGSVTVGEAQSIWELAQTARRGGPAVVTAVQGRSWHELSGGVAAQPELAPFVEGFSRFLRDHRHRGAAYKDIGFPRWGDKPDMLVELVRSYLTSTAKSPVEQNSAQAHERRRQQTELLRRSRLHPLRWLVLRRMFHYNEIYMGIRNDHRFYFDRLWYARRRVYASMGRRLVAAGVLDIEDDVFFLGTNEIDAGLAGTLAKAEAYRRIAVRRAEWENTLLRQAPKFLRGYTPVDDAATADGDGIVGIAASPGTAVGTARIIYRIEELPSVQDGDILVTRQTDPGWTPVFSKISGLVLETGGVLAHGTSLCREYGLPCVTAVERATARIPDGSRVRLDGSKGVIQVND